MSLSLCACVPRRREAAAAAGRAGLRHARGRRSPRRSASSATDGACRTSTRRARTICSSRRGSCRRRIGCSRWICGGDRCRAGCPRCSAPNFVERDAMTRRIQYRGDLDAEWASYGADTEGDCHGVRPRHQRLGRAGARASAGGIRPRRLETGALVAGRSAEPHRRVRRQRRRARRDLPRAARRRRRARGARTRCLPATAGLVPPGWSTAIARSSAR